jgi:hypothetical protein
MRWRDVAVVGGTALATAVVALAVFWTSHAVAVGPNESEKPEIQWPVLKAGGCEITLRTHQTSYKPGESPLVELEAVNTTYEAVSVQVTVQMMVQPPVIAVSRMGPFSGKAWTHTCELSLESLERTTLSIPTNVKVAAGTTIFFQLQLGKPGPQQTASAAVSTRPIAIPTPNGPTAASALPASVPIQMKNN